MSVDSKSVENRFSHRDPHDDDDDPHRDDDDDDPNRRDPHRDDDDQKTRGRFPRQDRLPPNSAHTRHTPCEPDRRCCRPEAGSKAGRTRRSQGRYRRRLQIR